MVDNSEGLYQKYNFAVAAAAASSTSEDGMIKEQDRLLPIANVGRIMKQILPPNAKISKEAKETMQECVSEFISFVTGEASDKCHKEKRKTVIMRVAHMQELTFWRRTLWQKGRFSDKLCNHRIPTHA